MDENQQDRANHNPVTIENKIWLPPSYTNNKPPISPMPKKKGINWGFANRTAFDWMILISQVLGAIAIPFVVLVIGLYATQQITQQQVQLNKSQHQTDLEVANDQQQEASLEAYLDHMSDLLLNNKLNQSKTGDEVREVARLRTLTALERLGPDRKRYVLLFLYEAKLINGSPPIISLIAANLSYVNLYNVGLDEANLVGVNFYHADMRFAQLEGTILDTANLSYTSMLYTNLYLASFFRTDLSYADLSHARFFLTDLSYADLSGANLSGTRLVSSSLDGANLHGANLHGADLRSVILSEADLSGADLSGADLRQVNLSGVNLNGVDLSGANLSKSTVTNKQLAKVKSLQGTIMPDGSKHS